METMPEGIIKYFDQLEDPREDGGNKRHHLIDILTISICSVISGAETWEDIELFGESKMEWFKKYLELPNGIPSHDTFARVFASIDPKKFNECYLQWINEIRIKYSGEVIAIDGKTVRHSFDREENKSAIHMVSAWAQKNGLVLGQVKVDEKSNEITAIPELLNVIDVQNCTVTIDAMGCQKDIAAKIIEKKADYLLALKGNQGTLYNDIKLYLDDAIDNQFKNIPHEYDETFDKDHGRLEKRRCWTTEDIHWLPQLKEWKQIKSICVIESERTIREQKSVERRYYISSLAANATNINASVRAHWSVENSLHWTLDIAFREDDCRKRKDHSAENFALLRHITLNLLKQDKSIKRSIKGKRLKCGWDYAYLERVLFGRF